MPDVFRLRLLLATFAGWTHRRQADAIAYLLEENRVLKEQLRGRRMRLTDDQRRRLAVRGKALGRQLLERLSTMTPDTILRWHPKLTAAKWTYPAKRRVGRPGLMRKLLGLIIRMAQDNATWGVQDPRRAAEAARALDDHHDAAGAGMPPSLVTHSATQPVASTLPASRPGRTPRSWTRSRAKSRATRPALVRPTTRARITGRLTTSTRRPPIVAVEFSDSTAVDALAQGSR